nr:MAG TPA: hypothetical protein [Microviridae sp.]
MCFNVVLQIMNYEHLIFRFAFTKVNKEGVEFT